MLQLPASTYVDRRRRLLEQLPPGGAMLLPTHGEVTRSNTTAFPFRPHSDFYYVSGFPEPDAWLLLKRDGEEPGMHLFVLPRDRERETWTGRRYGVDGAKECFGADHAWPLPELDEQLARLLADVDVLYFSFGRHTRKEARLHRILSKVRTGRKAELGPTTLCDPESLLAEMRLIKTPEELAVMRTGAEISAEAHIAAMRAVRHGMHEYEIQALVEYTFRRRGAWGWAYPSIVAGGDNACILHYVRNDGVFRDGELMLIDAGAEVDGYATDITRTTPVGAAFSGAQRDAYEVVLGVQRRAIEAVRPGASINGIHEQVLLDLTRGMVDLGVLHGDPEELVADKKHEAFYPHRTSHWLGCDVHDVGRYNLRTGPHKPLEAGQVLTVEPGLYFPADDERTPEAFKGIGIRIEDDVLVTGDGHEVLTAAVPKAVEELEALRREALG
ncbi:aminopeptidase P N-terminal domain-containing protein [Paraliomyxa miuraensis]|uniref:aminopeptidase P N-terminal domain-containing protein n=1 Tax=Paraliomyxa miuraensis TaxID=376150 RepID=UPI002258B2AE|nr:aminopeptidase P N-terminal domain-containing protein [Paraliomyxa miuraensis]MCX4247914.1 aminopeptidase P N-terminal domain-containing protein [Paraliomyxa miuraensis]